MSFNPLKRRAYGTTKAVISELFKQAGGVPNVMDILSLSRTRTYALSDPNDKACISFERVEKITLQTGATAAAEHLAYLAGGVYLPGDAFVKDGEDTVEVDWHLLAQRAGHHHADNISELLKSISPTSPSPGEVDSDEARGLLEKVDAQFALLALQRQHLLAILEERDKNRDETST